MLSSFANLDLIRSYAVAAACDKTCVIQEKTTTPGTTGEPLADYETVETTVAGMTQPTAGQLANYDYVIGSLATWLVKLPIGSRVKPQSLLLIEGQKLEVQVILDPHSFPVLLSVLASEVK